MENTDAHRDKRGQSRRLESSESRHGRVAPGPESMQWTGKDGPSHKFSAACQRPSLAQLDIRDMGTADSVGNWRAQSPVALLL